MPQRLMIRIRHHLSLLPHDLDEIRIRVPKAGDGRAAAHAVEHFAAVRELEGEARGGGGDGLGAGDVECGCGVFGLGLGLGLDGFGTGVDGGGGRGRGPGGGGVLGNGGVAGSCGDAADERAEAEGAEGDCWSVELRRGTYAGGGLKDAAW